MIGPKVREIQRSLRVLDHRWVSGVGTYSSNRVTISVELTSGGIFNASEPLAIQNPATASSPSFLSTAMRQC